jgi:hypothetical protein
MSVINAADSIVIELGKIKTALLETLINQTPVIERLSCEGTALLKEKATVTEKLEAAQQEYAHFVEKLRVLKNSLDLSNDISSIPVAKMPIVLSSKAPAKALSEDSSEDSSKAPAKALSEDSSKAPSKAHAIVTQTVWGQQRVVVPSPILKDVFKVKGPNISLPKPLSRTKILDQLDKLKIKPLFEKVEGQLLDILKGMPNVESCTIIELVDKLPTPLDLALSRLDEKENPGFESRVSWGKKDFQYFFNALPHPFKILVTGNNKNATVTRITVSSP